MNFYNLNCYPYLEYLFTTKEDDEILCNSLEVIYDSFNNEKDFFNKNIEQIIFKICDFMIKKSNHRFPFLKCMKLLDVYLIFFRLWPRKSSYTFYFVDKCYGT